LDTVPRAQLNCRYAVMNKPVVWLDRGQQFEVNGYYPTRLFWDMSDARLLVCEATRARAENLQQLTAATDTEVVVVVIVVVVIMPVFRCCYLCN